MKQSIKSRDKPTHLFSYYMTKEARICNGGKIVSLISATGKIGQLNGEQRTSPVKLNIQTSLPFVMHVEKIEE